MKSQNNQQLRDHYRDMRTLIAQIKASGLIAAQAGKLASKKELSEIVKHIMRAEIELNAAYRTISPEIKLFLEE